jgi:general stress protein YciG
MLNPDRQHNALSALDILAHAIREDATITVSPVNEAEHLNGRAFTPAEKAQARELARTGLANPVDLLAALKKAMTSRSDAASGGFYETRDEAEDAGRKSGRKFTIKAHPDARRNNQELIYSAPGARADDMKTTGYRVLYKGKIYQEGVTKTEANADVAMLVRDGASKADIIVETMRW